MKKIYKKEELSIDILNEISTYINKGALIVIPTETVYGLGCSIYFPSSIKKIYMLKSRPFSQPLTLQLDNSQKCEEFVEDTFALEFIKKYAPGPFTVIAKAKSTTPEYLVKNGFVGIRIPDYKITLDILKRVGPMAITSCNISGEKDITKIEDIPSQIEKGVDIIIDAGESPIKIPSTILKFENNKISILRKGSFLPSEIGLC